MAERAEYHFDAFDCPQTLSFPATCVPRPGVHRYCSVKDSCTLSLHINCVARIEEIEERIEQRLAKRSANRSANTSANSSANSSAHNGGRATFCQYKYIGRHFLRCRVARLRTDCQPLDRHVRLRQMQCKDTTNYLVAVTLCVNYHFDSFIQFARPASVLAALLYRTQL